LVVHAFYLTLVQVSESSDKGSATPVRPWSFFSFFQFRGSGLLLCPFLLPLSWERVLEDCGPTEVGARSNTRLGWEVKFHVWRFAL